MASIKDIDVGEKFSSKLEEIRTKLLSQAMSEVLNEATVEFCQAHKQYMKSVLGKTSALISYMHTSSRFLYIQTIQSSGSVMLWGHLHDLSPPLNKSIKSSSDCSPFSLFLFSSRECFLRARQCLSPQGTRAYWLNALRNTKDTGSTLWPLQISIQVNACWRFGSQVLDSALYHHHHHHQNTNWPNLFRKNWLSFLHAACMNLHTEALLGTFGVTTPYWDVVLSHNFEYTMKKRLNV